MSFSPGVASQHLLPQKLICRFIYRVSRSRMTWLKNLLIHSFCRLYDINLDEAERSDPRAYVSFNDFFTRALKPDARPTGGDDNSVVSPSDGRLTEFGAIERDRLIQAKGKSYTLTALLGESPELLETFHGGRFATIYLAPHNYHRVHSPLAGLADRGRYIPGKRFSVNAATTNAIDNLYCRNERVAVWVSTPIGYAVVVLVGAMNVSSLTTVLSGEIESGSERLISPDEPVELARGDELGQFNLGSTIVALFPRGTIEWSADLKPGQSVLMGQSLGEVIATTAEHR